jgi:hypothetical protein
MCTYMHMLVHSVWPRLSLCGQPQERAGQARNTSISRPAAGMTRHRARLACTFTRHVHLVTHSMPLAALGYGCICSHHNSPSRRGFGWLQHSPRWRHLVVAPQAVAVCTAAAVQTVVLTGKAAAGGTRRRHLWLGSSFLNKLAR